MDVEMTENGNQTTLSDEYHPLPPMHTTDPDAFFDIEDRMASALSSEIIRARSAELRTGIFTAITTTPPDLAEAKFLTLQLRQMNRLSNFRNRKLKNQILAAQHDADLVFLTFNNLANEIAHLKQTTATILKFRSADEKLDLVPAEEFLIEAPTVGIEVDENIQADSHKLQIGRLNLELKQRERMCENLRELEIRKTALTSDINGKNVRLSQIQSQIRSVQREAKKLGEMLGLKKVPTIKSEVRRKIQSLHKWVVVDSDVPC